MWNMQANNNSMQNEHMYHESLTCTVDSEMTARQHLPSKLPCTSFRMQRPFSFPQCLKRILILRFSNIKEPAVTYRRIAKINLDYRGLSPAYGQS